MWRIAAIPFALLLVLVGFLTDTTDTLLPIAFFIVYITLGNMGEGKKKKRRRPSPAKTERPKSDAPATDENRHSFPIPPILGAPPAEQNSTNNAPVPNAAPERMTSVLDDFLEELEDFLDASSAKKNTAPIDEETGEETPPPLPQRPMPPSATLPRNKKPTPSPYNLTPRTALQAVALAEILGKPKALKNAMRQRR